MNVDVQSASSRTGRTESFQQQEQLPAVCLSVTDGAALRHLVVQSDFKPIRDVVRMRNKHRFSVVILSTESTKKKKTPWT